MGISSAVQWWEEWQLRILVLSSLVIQYLLCTFAVVRKFPIRSWFRPFIWLAYLVSDAIAIYALATLFNRHKKENDASSILEVVWAPILLIHLGGQDGITAYNIEDNELWTRHILTALSQISVAIYVFCKSWPGGDNRLQQAAILLFVPGIWKCLEKPMALNRASINSLVTSPKTCRRTIGKHKISSVEEFVQAGRDSTSASDYHRQTLPTVADYNPCELFVDLASPSFDDRIRKLKQFSGFDGDEAYRLLQKGLSDTFELLYTKVKTFFVAHHEYISSTQEKKEELEHSGPTQEKKEELEHSGSLESPIIKGSLLKKLLITVNKVIKYELQNTQNQQNKHCKGLMKGGHISMDFWVFLVRGVSLYLQFAAIGLFHHSHREAYSGNDVKVTYTLLCCTVVLEMFGPHCNGIQRSQVHHLRQLNNSIDPEITVVVPEDMVYQYNLLGYFARNRRHPIITSITVVLGCKDYIDQHWRIKSSNSSRSITSLVHKHVKGWWDNDIKDYKSYRICNSYRGQGILRSERCFKELIWSMDGAFDESVLLWHLATDFCYYYVSASPVHQDAATQCKEGSCAKYHRCHAWCKRSIRHERAVQCRTMSNYMTYLLFVNPEMLLAGTRRYLFTDAYNQLQGIIKEKDAPLDEMELINRIIHEVRKLPNDKNIMEKDKLAEVKQDHDGIVEEDMTSQVHEPHDVEQEKNPVQETGLIRDAWAIAEVLVNLSDEERMWKVIEGVWVEMLCFSAARCRGYLHAKGLGTGVEFLSYIWLLMHYMGMETLGEKLARPEISSDDESATGTSTSETSSSRGKQVAPGPFTYQGSSIMGEENV